MLKFHNTLSGKLEGFKPLEDGKVRLYFCGPTVYDYAHIGNFRSIGIFADVLVRTLRFKGYDVTHVMNITDVEDKIIRRAKEENLPIDVYTAKYIEALWQDFDALGCVRPTVVPRATHYIDEMVEIIERLIEKGHAYESDGSIYYRVASFPEYGKLSKINFAGNIAGASERVDADSYDKEDARDFALWKAVTDPAEVAWETHLGRGRPGWHIECSAMSIKNLGETFDIHAGGIDLVFPHHENEIAQSEGATGREFARYWLHAAHLKVEGETMSKSRGNFYTFRDLIELGYKPVAIRYLLMSVPYNKPLNFTFDALKAAEKSVTSLRDFRSRLIESSNRVDDKNRDEGANVEGGNVDLHPLATKALRDFEAGLSDDLNTAVALAAVHDLARETNKLLADDCLPSLDRRAIINALDRMDTVLNIFGSDTKEMLDAEIQTLIDERQEARRRRDFKRADDIRDTLDAQGIVLEDTRNGVRWKRK